MAFPAWWQPEVRGFIALLAPALKSAGQSIRVTSGIRTLEENARVGGKAQSQHLVGLAVDLVAPDLASLAAHLRGRGLVVVTDEPGHRPHVHVQRYAANTVPKATIAQLAR
jgi:hypothetical protein